MGGEKNQINLNYKIKSNAKIKHKTIFLAKGNQEFVFNDNYEFLSPNSTGKFNIYGILKNNAKSNNLANIIVNEKANKIKSRINIKLHLLGNKTQGLMLPRLDINNDDVQAGHSASLANISQDELFYMQTRGISKTMAEKLMIDEIFSNFNKELFSEKIAKHIKL